MRSVRRFTAIVASIAVSLLIVFACLLGVLVGVWAMEDNDVVNHEVASPDGKIIALVIRDDCGATCGCAVRVDLQTADQYVRKVYRSFKACDAVVTWVSTTELRVQEENNEAAEAIVNIQDWGIVP